MDKYINADKLMEIIKTHHYMLANATNSRDFGMFTIGIEQAISETESVEVVRCKDCKKFRNAICRKFMICTKPTDYCSYAEMRESE